MSHRPSSAPHRILPLRKTAFPALVFLASLSAGCGSDDRPADGTTQTANSDVSKDIRAQRFFEDGLIRARAEDWPGALIQFNNALKADPDYLPALVELGKAHLAHGTVAAAEDALRRARRRGADERTIALPLAQARLELGLYDAILDETSVADLPPATAVEYLLIAARAAELVRGDDAALDYLQRARRLAPEDLRPALAEVDLYFRTAATTTARAALATLEKRYPEDARVQLMLGEDALRSGDITAGRAAFERAVALNPELTAAQVGAARMELLDGRPAAAAERLQPLYDRSDADPDLAYSYALALFQSARAEEAGEVLGRVAELVDSFDPSTKQRYPLMLKLSTLVNMARGDLDQAENDAVSLVALNNRSAEARFLLGRIQLDLGDPVSAAGNLDFAATVLRDNSAVLAALGEAQLGAGQAIEALRTLERAHELAPEDRAVRLLLARAAIARGDEARAEAILGTIDDRTHGETVLLLRAYLSGGQEAKALTLADEQLAAAPDDPAALKVAAMTYHDVGNLSQARSLLAKALAVQEDDLEARLRLAEIDALLGDEASAADGFRAVLAQDREAVGALLGLSRLAAREGRYAEAIEHAERAQALGARRPEAQMALARLYRKAGRPLDALELMEALVSRLPENVEVLLLQADMLVDAGQESRARTVLRRAVRFAGFSVDELVRIARRQVAAQDLEGADISLRKAAGTAPDDMRIKVDTLRLAVLTGRLDDARRKLDDLKRTNPDSALPLVLQAELAEAEGDVPAAIAAYQRAFARQPAPALALKLAPLLLAQGQEHAAAALLREAVASEPSHFQARLALSTVLVELQEDAEARALLETLERERPDVAEIHNNLAWMALRSAPAQALAHARRAHELAPNSAAVLDTLGWVLVEQGEPLQGVAYLRDALSRRSDAPSIRYHLAAGLAAQDPGSAEAREQLRRALRSTQRFPERSAADALLARLDAEA